MCPPPCPRVCPCAQASGGDDADKIEMTLIENELRKRDISLKRPAGDSGVGDGVGTMEDIKLAGLALTLFGSNSKTRAHARHHGTHIRDCVRAHLALRAFALFSQMSVCTACGAGKPSSRPETATDKDTRANTPLKFGRQWRKVGMARMATSILQDLESLRDQE